MRGEDRMILDRLKEATRDNHQRLEEGLDVSSRLFSLSDYRSLLLRWWGFYVPIERDISFAVAQTNSQFEFGARRKTGLLLQDLQALGVSEAELKSAPQCADLPELRDFAAALGCLYVLEGATLGGQIISRLLRQNLGLTAENGAAFFNAYGKQTGRMWQTRGFG